MTTATTHILKDFWEMKFGRSAEQVFREKWGAKHIHLIPPSLHKRSVNVMMVSKDGQNWYWGHEDFNSGTSGSCTIFDNREPFVTTDPMKAFYMHELGLAKQTRELLNRQLQINAEVTTSLTKLIGG